MMKTTGTLIVPTAWALDSTAWGTPNTKTAPVTDKMRLSLGLSGSYSAGTTADDKGVGFQNWSGYWLSDAPGSNRGFLDYGSGFMRLLSQSNVPITMGCAGLGMLNFISPGGSFTGTDLAVELLNAA